MVLAGAYPAQTILADRSKNNGRDVVLEAAPGALVRLTGRLSLGSGTGGADDAPSHLVLRNLTAPKQRVQVLDPARYITLSHLQAGSFYLDGAQHVTVTGGSYGNCGSEDAGCEGGGAGSQNWIKDDISGSRTSDIVVRGVTIHDYLLQRSGDHYECLFILGGTRITVEGSRFYRCEIYDIILQANGPNPISGVTIQNNWFGRTEQQGGTLRGSAVVLAQHSDSRPLSDVLIRFNSFALGEGLVDEGFAFGAYTGVRAVGNIFGTDGGGTTNPAGGGGFRDCLPAVAYDSNVWRAGSCGRNSRSLRGGPMPYVNTSDLGAMNYHLGHAAIAQNAVRCASADCSLRVDIDGQRRPHPANSARDAGADER